MGDVVKGGFPVPSRATAGAVGVAAMLNCTVPVAIPVAETFDVTVAVNVTGLLAAVGSKVAASVVVVVDWTPVPESGTETGEPAPLVIERLAATAPVATGVKVTVIVQFPPTAIAVVV